MNQSSTKEVRQFTITRATDWANILRRYQDGRPGLEKGSQPWRHSGHEGPDPQLTRQDGRGLRLGQARPQECHEVKCLLARLRLVVPLRQELR